MAADGIERRPGKFTGFVYSFFLAGMMIPFHLYMIPLFRQMKVFHIFGTMAKGTVSIDGKEYRFDVITGILTGKQNSRTGTGHKNESPF